jgi:hypothetical protein
MVTTVVMVIRVMKVGAASTMADFELVTPAAFTAVAEVAVSMAVVAAMAVAEVAEVTGNLSRL